MRGPQRSKDRPKEPASLRRSFVTPEGVDLRLELGAASARATAFLIDAATIVGILLVTTIIFAFALSGDRSGVFAIVWMIGYFILRNGWFTLFELGGRGATPAKRIMRLRVVARDGARLTGGAVLVRNAMREIEVFLPLSFLLQQAVRGTADTFLTVFALAWSGIFLFFPLFNRDRLRVGDMLAGTWVVQTAKVDLGYDLAASTERPRRAFSDAALDLYGVYELQTLEHVLRGGEADTVATVAAAIRNKAGLPDEGYDEEFLGDYYAALCARLERGMMVGRRRENKHVASV